MSTDVIEKAETGLVYRPVEPLPMAHQAAALRHVVKRGGVAGLLMDPGTGKSRVVVDYLGMLQTKYGDHDVLITAPLSALDTWPEQIERWLPPHVPRQVIMPEGTVVEKAEQIKALAGTPANGLRVVLLNHDVFAQKRLVKGLKTVTLYDRIMAAIEAWHPDALVVDESHLLKGHGSHRSKAHAKMADYIPRRLILTGTVAPASPLDLFGQWQTLNKRTFGDDWHAFRHTYAKWGGYMEKQAVRWLNQDTMKTLVRADAYVAKAEDCLDLPPVSHIHIPVHLGPKEAKVYREMEQEQVATLPSGEQAISPLAITKLLRLRQICGGFVGFEDDDGAKHNEQVGDTKLRVCRDKVEHLVDAGKKVVIFAHFRAEIAALAEAVTKHFKGRVPVYTVTGDTPKKARLSQREEFRDHEGPAVFVAQMRTMSLSVNELVVAQHAIFYSLSERRDDYDQALKRLDRQGQTAPVFIYHLVVPDSMDEVLHQSHAEKLRLETAVIGYVRKARERSQV